MIDKERETQLRQLQDKAIDHAAEEMSAAAQLGIDNKEDRGNRYWLSKMATQSMTLAAKIEGFIMLRNRDGVVNPKGDSDDYNAADRLIKNARGEVDKIIKKAQGGLPKREH